MTAFINCEGTSSSAQSFTVTGEHLTGDDGQVIAVSKTSTFTSSISFYGKWSWVAETVYVL